MRQFNLSRCIEKVENSKKELVSLCESLVNKSLLLYANADEPIKSDLEIVTAYFAVGAKL